MRDQMKKYVAAGLTAFCTIAASILLYFCFERFSLIKEGIHSFLLLIEPFLIGIILAYIMAPFYNKIYGTLKYSVSKSKHLKEKGRTILASTVAIMSSALLIIIVVFGIFALVIPSFISNITVIIDSIQDYTANFSLWIQHVLSHYPSISSSVSEWINDIFTNFMVWLNNKLTPDAENMLSALGNLSSVFSGVWIGVKIITRFLKDILIGIIVSCYLLLSKKTMIAQVKKLIYSVFKIKIGNYLMNECRYIISIFGGFLRGKLLDSLIIGLLCFIGASIFNFPFPVVVSVIIGITNIVPFFGPIIGAIPCGVLILLVSPYKCILFIIFILILQQFDGNILGPKILGYTTGISSFWVLFSVIFFGGLFGFVGMTIAVPLFAVLYSLVRDFVNFKLKKQDLIVNTDRYVLLDKIDPSTKEFAYFDDTTEKK